MRIGLIVTGGFDRSDRERVVPALLWLAERLAPRHDVEVFALHHAAAPCSYALRGAIVHDLGRVEGPPLLRRHRVRRRLAAALARAGRFDVLHAYLGWPAIVAAPAPARIGTPLVITLDSGELVSLPEIGYGLQRRRLDRRALAAATGAASAVTVSTIYMARQPALGGRNVSVVPMGVDARLFPLAERHDGPPWRLLRVASVNPIKDYPTLLDAVGLARARGFDVHLDIVGEDTLAGAVQRRVRELALDPHVSFHGFQPTDRLASFYHRAHLHVVSSRHEAASVAVLEAAATGLPTVGTRVGYVADWAGDAAEAVPTGDPKALAEAIIALLQDRPRRERLASAARTWTLAHDADWTADAFERIYTRAAAAPR